MREKQNWYSVSELSTTFGKSESTIKRYADKLKTIEPLAVEVRNKKIFICSDYLHLILSDQERTTGENERPLNESLKLQYESTIEILKSELSAKNRQIEQLTNTIENLTNTTDLQNKLMTKLTYQISSPGENNRAWWQFWRKK